MAGEGDLLFHGDVDKFAEMALEAPNDTRAVFFAKVSERQKQLADVEARMRAAGAMSTATNVEFAEVEREARERFGKLGELIKDYPAEMRAVVRVVLAQEAAVTRGQHAKEIPATLQVQVEKSAYLAVEPGHRNQPMPAARAP